MSQLSGTEARPGTLPDFPSNRIFGTGEMADRIRAFDWSSTPVVSIEQWSETLLITVNTMLGTRHPMFLWWGSELTQFYNDAYRPSLGSDKHPSPSDNLAPSVGPRSGPSSDPRSPRS